jgi:hypothetical protein
LKINELTTVAAALQRELMFIKDCTNKLCQSKNQKNKKNCIKSNNINNNSRDWEHINMELAQSKILITSLLT